MSYQNFIIGWCDAYGSAYPTTSFTAERKLALIECMRKRKYNFNHFDHEMLSYGAPLYNDKRICVLSKQQWDAIISEVYKELPMGPRKLPIDTITIPAKNGVLYEKEKYLPKEEKDNV
jgi:hypothetical protein